jgi:hypothetical protein
MATLMKILVLFLFFGTKAEYLVKIFPARFSFYGWIIWDVTDEYLVYYSQGKRNQCSLDGKCSVGSSPLIPYPHNVAINNNFPVLLIPIVEK